MQPYANVDIRDDAAVHGKMVIHIYCIGSQVITVIFGERENKNVDFAQKKNYFRSGSTIIIIRNKHAPGFFPRIFS